jgi:hypothetical protein
MIANLIGFFDSDYAFHFAHELGRLNAVLRIQFVCEVNQIRKRRI